MKIINYLNVPELINEIKKNCLPLNIIFISALILPFSLYLGTAVIEPLIFLICISYLYIVISKNEKISFNAIIIFFFKFLYFIGSFFDVIKFCIDIIKIFFVFNKVCYFNFCNYSHFKKIKLLFKIFSHFKFFMFKLTVVKWTNTIFFLQRLLYNL